MVEQGEYRVLLQDLHSELPDDDVKYLKFLAQPLIKKRMYQQIQDGLGLFEALEDCRMLSRSRLDFLSDLLETVGRLDLQARIREEAFITCDAVRGEDSLICPFRKLLFNLHKEIPDYDLQRMRYLWGKVPKRATVEDPIDLFGFMIREQSLTPENLNDLKRIFAEISRQDLVEECERFEVTVTPKECGYSGLSIQSFGPQFEEASLQSSTFPSSSYPASDPSSMQEWGHSTQDTEGQISGPVFEPASLSSSFTTTQSDHAQHNGNAINDLKDSAAPPGAAGLVPGLGLGREPGLGLGLGMTTPVPETSAGDFNRYSEQERNGASSDYYKMTAEPRGLCLIIDVQTFKPDHLKYRAGSEFDRTNLRSTFEDLKFTVREMVNPTSEEILKQLELVSKNNHAAEDCLVICILSHGGINYFYGSDGEKVFEERVFCKFCAKECPTLAGKPKLFFFSYCRGVNEQEGVEVHDDLETDGPLVPDYSDFLFGFATPQNYVSYRNRSTGTFYIEVLTQVLREDARRSELQHLLLRVNREVSEKDTGPGKTNRQIPKPEHTLKRQLYFL